ncbi:MAG: hypothetical protein K6E53_00415 [Lachnospiraceae bacterium]|nr:hypothetical protein [Lachnospiraceae bacterium]
MIRETTKRMHIIAAICILITSAMLITSCGSSSTSPDSPAVPVSDEPAANEPAADEPSESEPAADEPVIVVDSDDENDTIVPEAEQENDTSKENEDSSSDTTEETLPPAASNAETVYKGEKDHVDVVWLGDSLTQGSLGWDNNNKDNPQAPWRVLADISGWNVTGAGYFGYKTDDIFWSYTEFGGVKDPSSIYVFWVGSNDFAQSVDNIVPVMDSIDHFMEIDGLKKYLVLGTTNRGDMDPNAYKGINEHFEKKYGDNYLDIMPYVEYGPDNIHLTENSSRAVAEAVYNKLKELY